MSYLTQAIGAVKLASRAHGPTIMVVSGVISMGASVLTASKKTLEVEKVLEPHVESLEKIQKGTDLMLSGYTTNEARSDRFKVYSRAGVDLGKLYFVPGVLFFGGAALVFGGHRIMLKRNATLAIAFTGVQKAFEAYRGRVREEFGTEVDQAMLNGWKQVQYIDPETQEVYHANTRDWDAAENDPYNRVFAEGETTLWVDDLSVNKMNIQNVLRMANTRLGLQGYLYLNDVYEALGFPKNDIGQVAGWKVKHLPDGSKDIPFIDFGLDRPHPDDWKYSRENAIYLDINCQGLIVGGRVQKELEKR